MDLHIAWGNYKNR